MVVNGRFFTGISSVSRGQTIPDTRKQTNAGGDFQKILEQKTAENSQVKFSKHAETRLQNRNISLTREQQQKLENAVNKADTKGVRDSLVLLDDIAFVVNVKNRLVITAVNSTELKDNVFTNIDGAVIA